MNRWLIIPALLLTQSVGTAAAGNIESYLRYPGRAPDSVNVQIAHEIFDTLKRSTRSLTSASELVVVDSDREPWAVALADGNIVLSRGALEVVFRAGDSDLARARLAFVLGHELAHQFNGDHYHEEIREIRSVPGKLSSQHEIDIDRSHQREIVADIRGFLFASVAGFRTDLLLPDTQPENAGNFLNYWVNQTGTQLGESHPSAVERTRILLDRLAVIDVSHFEYGARLVHFGDLEGAATLLENFERPFLSTEITNSEVLNVLGYLELKKAQSLLDSEIRYRFWFPALLETDISMPFLATSRSAANRQRAREIALENAIDHLGASLAMNPDNETGIVNLAIANMLDESFGTAKDILKKALKKKPEHRLFRHLLALAMHAEGAEPDAARHTLLNASQSVFAEPYAVYNTARVLHEQAYDEMAQAEFGKLLRVLNRIPVSYQVAVCSALKQECNRGTADNAIDVASSFASQLPAAPGTQLDVSKLDGWMSGDSARSNHRIYRKGADSILVEDFTVKMVVLGAVSIGYESPEKLIDRLGQPDKRISASSAELWSYGPDSTVKVVAGKVSEIWLYNRSINR